MGGKRGKWLIQVLNTVKLLAAPGSLLVEWATRMESQLWPFLCQFSCDFPPRMNYQMLQLILPFRSHHDLLPRMNYKKLQLILPFRSQVSFVNCHGLLLQLWLRLIRSRSKEGRVSGRWKTFRYILEECWRDFSGRFTPVCIRFEFFTVAVNSSDAVPFS